jgi:hypothetical protein
MPAGRAFGKEVDHPVGDIRMLMQVEWMLSHDRSGFPGDHPVALRVSLTNALVSVIWQEFASAQGTGAPRSPVGVGPKGASDGIPSDSTLTPLAVVCYQIQNTTIDHFTW